MSCSFYSYPISLAADNHQYLNAAFLEGKGGSILCLDKDIESHLLNEVKEVIFNEEFRAILRRNLFAMDPGDVGARMTSDIIQCLQENPITKNVQGGWGTPNGGMKTPKSVFLLGAGGMGMAPLALYLQGAGIHVSAI